jgi:hypothetical protein
LTCRSQSKNKFPGSDPVFNIARFAKFDLHQTDVSSTLWLGTVPLCPAIANLFEPAVGVAGAGADAAMEPRRVLLGFALDLIAPHARVMQGTYE